MKSASSCLCLSVFFLWGLTAPPLLAQSPGELVGPVSKQQVLESDRIYDIYFNRYQPDKEAVRFLQAEKDSISIFIFWGNWCPESKKHIPRLMKTLHLAGNQKISAQYIATDSQKKLPKSFLKKFDIKYIPTVVVLKGDTEVGRIDHQLNHPIESNLIQILKRGIQN